MADELQNIIFVAVPDSLERTIGSFRVDPDRMLPVEITSGTDRYDIHDLSWEQIVSAMLKILAYAPDHEDAAYYREFVLAVAPDIVADLTQTAILKSRNADFDLAEEIFLALRGLQPGDERALVNLALLYEQRADAERRAGHDAQAEEYVDEAHAIYDELFSRDEPILEAHLNAGYFYLKQKRYDDARRHLESYAASSTDADRLEEVRSAIAHIESHDLGDSLFRESFDLIQAGREQEGVASARKFLESHPDVWNAWFMLGWGLRRLREYDEARRAFEKALELGPRQPDTLNELAICHLELGDFPAARALLTEALAAEPENTKIISNLGILALKQGDKDQAAGYFRTVLEIEPDDRIAQTYLDEITG